MVARNRAHFDHRAADRIEVAPGIQLARTFWTHAKPLHVNAVYAALRQLSGQWPMGHTPQGFLLLYARSFKGYEIQVADAQPVTVATRVQSPSTVGNHVGGPYLVLVVVGEYPEAHGYAPLRAYAQPVLNGRLPVPVESEFERKVLNSILRCQVALYRRGIDVAIQKPLFDTLTGRGPCRPVFRIEAVSRQTGEIRTVIVEAVGLDTDAYQAAKAVTHPRMQELGRLVEIDPNDLETGQSDRVLMSALDM